MHASTSALKKLALFTWSACLGIPLVAMMIINGQPARAQQLTPSGVNTANLYPKGDRCLKYTDINLNLNTKLTGPGLRRLLTPEAVASGVEVYTTGGEDNKFGNVSLMYWQPQGECVLWYETIGVVEYATRLGLTPYDVSPFFKKDAN